MTIQVEGQSDGKPVSNFNDGGDGLLEMKLFASSDLDVHIKEVCCLFLFYFPNTVYYSYNGPCFDFEPRTYMSLLGYHSRTLDLRFRRMFEESLS